MIEDLVHKELAAFPEHESRIRQMKDSLNDTIRGLFESSEEIQAISFILLLYHWGIAEHRNFITDTSLKKIEDLTITGQSSLIREYALRAVGSYYDTTNNPRVIEFLKALINNNNANVGERIVACQELLAVTGELPMTAEELERHPTSELLLEHFMNTYYL